MVSFCFAHCQMLKEMVASNSSLLTRFIMIAFLDYQLINVKFSGLSQGIGQLWGGRQLLYPLKHIIETSPLAAFGKRLTRFGILAFL